MFLLRRAHYNFAAYDASYFRKGDKSNVRNIVFSVLLSTLAPPTIAGTEQPYKGLETRQIKALSQQEIDGYLRGSGMGYAKAAELNHYPGPKHVLELAEELALTQEQTKQTEAIYEKMRARAIAFGEKLVRKEQKLGQQFAKGSINAASLSSLVLEIGELQAKIRHVHLAAHLEQKALLRKHQIHLYSQLRGYGTAQSNKRHHAH